MVAAMWLLKWDTLLLQISQALKTDSGFQVEVGWTGLGLFIYLDIYLFTGFIFFIIGCFA